MILEPHVLTDSDPQSAQLVLGDVPGATGHQREGFADRDDVAYELTLSEDLRRRAELQPVFGLDTEPTTDIEARTPPVRRQLV